MEYGCIILKNYAYDRRHVDNFHEKELKIVSVKELQVRKGVWSNKCGRGWFNLWFGWIIDVSGNNVFFDGGDKGFFVYGF